MIRDSRPLEGGKGDGEICGRQWGDILVSPGNHILLDWLCSQPLDPALGKGVGCGGEIQAPGEQRGGQPALLWVEGGLGGCRRHLPLRAASGWESRTSAGEMEAGGCWESAWLVGL